MSDETHKAPAPTPEIELPERGEPKITNKQRMGIPRQPMPHQGSQERVGNFNEVALGLEARAVRIEALRCLQCKDRACMTGCPVGIDIPAFVKKVAEGDFQAGVKILKMDNVLPAVCGRVCPQEEQCEAVCTIGKKTDPVAIGRIERFLADWEREAGVAEPIVPGAPTGKKVAVVGGGPAGITAAADLVKLGHAVEVFEALHRPGGVLVYGIPEFRLPKKIVEVEVQALERAGVQFHNSVVIGQTISLDELRETFDAVFVATGAGLPNFMNVPGENLCGIYAANEYLTRVNLMRAYDRTADTPVARSKAVAVVGGGNVAMDAARTARRLGAEHVYLVYRRTRQEMPARLEEIAHAEEEGIEFLFLHNPIRYEGDAEGRVQKAVLQKMVLGEPDASGRRKPVATKEEVELTVDTAVVSIGNGPNPLVPRTSPGLKVKKWGNILTEKASGRTSLKGVWAGGDIVLGAATVILAMGAGRSAARSIHEYLTTGIWSEPTLDS